MRSCVMCLLHKVQP